MISAMSSDSNQGSCEAAGFEECCLHDDQAGTSCYGNPPTCHCDALCYFFDDCCDDVASIGCMYIGELLLLNRKKN